MGKSCIDRETLFGFVQSTCVDVFELDVSLIEHNVARSAVAEHVTATVQLTGPEVKVIVVDCGVGLAKTIGSGMFGSEPDELKPDEVNDALGEMANMVAGSVKAALLDSTEYRLSIPTIIRGSTFTLGLPQTALDVEIYCECQDALLSVRVLTKTIRL